MIIYMNKQFKFRIKYKKFLKTFIDYQNLNNNKQ